MIKVRKERDMFIYMMRKYREMVDDIDSTHMYLTCTEDQYKRFKLDLQYYKERGEF